MQRPGGNVILVEQKLENKGPRTVELETVVSGDGLDKTKNRKMPFFVGVR